MVKAVITGLVGLVLGLAPCYAQGTPKFVTAGKLSCGARMVSPTQMQTWCYKVSNGVNVLVQNTITSLSDTVGNVGGSAFINFVDSTPGEAWVMIGWSVWFDHTDAKYHYSVSWQVNLVGPSTLQTGTF